MKKSRDVTARTTGGMFGRLAWQTPLALHVCLALASPSANATTEAENTRANTPMPHEKLGAGGTLVKVHFTRLDGYLEGRPDNAAQLVELKAQTQKCVRQHQETGRPTNPPHAWPDFVLSTRTDRYSAANRTIEYKHGLTYGLNQSDCSLLEIVSASARLTSSLGSCDIDLLKKTATGVCDTQAHGNASLRLRAPASSLADVEEALRKAPDNPGLTALAAVTRQHPPASTGERKTILGLECEVWKNPLDPEGTICFSRGGSFTAFGSNGAMNQSAMMLEMTSVAGIKLHAVAAKLDTMVDGVVFAPYLAGGFAVTNRGPRK
jgi:hypothetical protein